MNDQSRPLLNLELDLLRTFVAVADLHTFAAAAIAVCRTQSAVSQQMQRLEQITGKILFARQGRNKLLTEHGMQLLGYARKILRFNDEACLALMSGNEQKKLTIGVADNISGAILSGLLQRITSMYLQPIIDVQTRHQQAILEMLAQGQIDLAITTSNPHQFPSQILRSSPTLWYCAASAEFQQGEEVPLVLLAENDIHHQMAITALDNAGIPWRTVYTASSLTAVRAAVTAGLGITASGVELMDPELRVIGLAEGLITLPATDYLLCCHPQNDNQTALAVFNTLLAGSTGYSSQQTQQEN